MNQVEKNCLSCKYYRLMSEVEGLCKVDRKNSQKKEYPKRDNHEICDKWTSCGQNFYIRMGWIKSKLSAQSSGC